jgi:hypothetical protein
MDHVPADGRIVAICDCFRQRYEEALKVKGKNWNTYQYYQKMFEKEKLDAVVVATTDHARVLPCIRACQAGLDRRDRSSANCSSRRRSRASARPAVDRSSSSHLVAGPPRPRAPSADRPGDVAEGARR